MALNLKMSEREELKPRITVFGVGGAGGNAVNNMIDKQLEGVEFVVANTDAQALQQSNAKARIQIGIKVTEGLGAGARPAIGAAAAEESIEEIVDHLAGAHMCFITCGMGGGTGTGAAPIIAQAARELGVLTVGVVTKPFQFEGAKRMRQADEGIEALQKVVDTLIIIPNQNLFRLANEKTTFTEAFVLADDVLYQGVKGVTDLMVRPGLINLDFADVRAVMDEMGKAMMGTGEASGENRAIQAAEMAIANPLLDEISLRGARGVLINIIGGSDLTLFELDEAANRIREEVDPDANIIVGSTLDDTLNGCMRVSVVATGIDAAQSAVEVQPQRRRLAEPNETAHQAAQAVQHPAPRMAQPAPQPAPQPMQQPVQQQPVMMEPEPAPAPAPVQQQERNLFNAQPSQAEYYDEDDSDELPAPAYRPQPQREIHASVDSAGDFVAPRARAAGTPSPEAIARLAAAVNRAPTASQRPQAQAPRPAMQPRAAAPAPAADKPRFGINSLINRMTGSHPADHGERLNQAMRQQPQVTAQQHYEDEVDPEQDRIEIPAFLRRQAN